MSTVNGVEGSSFDDPKPPKATSAIEDTKEAQETFTTDDAVRTQSTYAQSSSDNPFFIHNLSYTSEEEARVVRILDMRLFPWILLTTFVLNMDRTNHSNAVSDNLPADLGFTINTVNLGVAIYSVLFSLACLSGAVIAKIIRPSRWIPILMFSWGLVTMAHALVTNRSGYLTVRCMIAVTEGGVIPATLIYLGSFYRGTELATRLAWFWGVQTIASAVSGLMASGLLQLRGTAGLEGWKWLFLVDGIITVVVAIATWFYLPRNVARTKGGIRGIRPWFDDRQVRIAVTRVVRDDPSKRVYEKKVRWDDIRDAVTDIGLWGHLLIAAISLTPTTPLQTLVTIRHADKVRERGYHGVFGSAWQLVGWILLRALPPQTSKGVKYFAAIVVASWPYTHPLNIAWMSENTGSVGKRTLASGSVIFAANIYGVWASQIYQAKDSPDFRTGNTINIVFAGVALILWFVQKQYYRYRNACNAKKFAELGDKERRTEEEEWEEKGNRSLLFKFTT
ncbi:hypothetical protein VKT23_013429 [Stygiomarasmius scandens]|uniref:MFS general substrate transporter n=1 Tax=Marasmiellus scandens TaxID=2682957 RepID=A0ABR1J3Z9_9AGAR